MRLVKYLIKNPKKKEEVFRLIIKPDFREAVDMIRKKFDIDIEMIEQQTNESEAERKRLVNDDDVQDAARSLIKKFKLSNNWLDLIIDYITTDEFVPSADIDFEGLTLEIDLDQNPSAPEREGLLRINSNTKLSDIKKAWPVISKALDTGRHHKNIPWRHFWRDYDIYKLADKGATVFEIQKGIKKKYGGSELDAGHIYKIDSEFKRRIGIDKSYRKVKLKLRRIPDGNRAR
jgi:hypothetical protein